MGGINKTQFRLNANLYNPDIPRYVDFFRTEARFRDNYYVQAYLGNHFLSLKDCEAALPYFERSLELARNHSESKEASQRIGFCRRALGQKT
jgi:tetratricopeptide (TPR) repeat protein